MNINEQLFNLYSSNLSGLQQLYKELDDIDEKDYCGPFLVYCWEDFYNSSNYKLVIIGQETYGWEGSSDYIRNDDDVRRSIESYRDFEIGKLYKKIFLKYAHNINHKLNGDSSTPNFVWTNINKFGKEDTAGKPAEDVLLREVSYYNLFEKEIEILNPDVCIFLTGPNYDSNIKDKIPDIVFEEFLGYPLNELALLKSSHLPQKSYRLYHPGYGNRYYEWYNEMIDKIIEHIMARMF